MRPSGAIEPSPQAVERTRPDHLADHPDSHPDLHPAPRSAKDMPSCTSCGQSSPTGYSFCLNCGSKIGAAVELSHAGETPREAKPLPPICPQCGTQNQIGTHFCQHCGRAIAASTAPEGGGQPPQAVNTAVGHGDQHPPPDALKVRNRPHPVTPGPDPSFRDGPRPMSLPSVSPASLVPVVLGAVENVPVLPWTNPGRTSVLPAMWKVRRFGARRCFGGDRCQTGWVVSGRWTRDRDRSHRATNRLWRSDALSPLGNARLPQSRWLSRRGVPTRWRVRRHW